MLLPPPKGSGFPQPKKFMKLDYSNEVEKIKNGDMEAFEFVYKDTYSWIRNIVYRYIQNENDMDDVLQNIYTKAFTQLPKLNEPKTFVKWLQQIAIHESINELQKKKALKNSLIDYLPMTSESFDKESKHQESMDMFQVDQSLSEFNPEANIDEKETRYLLNQILLDLSDMQRACILLWKDEYSTKEMAKMLKIPTGTVKTHIFQAKKRIKTKVLELEKNGTKLYGIAPIPFFLWLFKQEDFFTKQCFIDNAAIIETGKSIAKNITGQLSVGTKANSIHLSTHAVGIIKKSVIVAASTVTVATAGYYVMEQNHQEEQIKPVPSIVKEKEPVKESEKKVEKNDIKPIVEEPIPIPVTPEAKTSTPPSKPTEPSKPQKPAEPKPQAHTHNWVQQYTTVNHEATGHTEQTWVVDTPAWDEPIYESHNFCNKCGIDMGNGDPTIHSVMCKSSYHAERVQVGIQHHDEVGHYESKWVEDSPAWSEQVANGFKCSGCGATK